MRYDADIISRKLTLFPSPYPGESFYSILCRYHVRSGNSCDWHTIHQLFGKNRSLRSTLLSPFHIQYADNWFVPGTGVSTESLLRQHTAFNLFALISSEYERIQILDMASGKKASTSYPIQVQSRLKHPSGFLRYCPKCAETQRKLYGESYWQILPQLDGCEYCPIHKCRILNSPVRLENITNRFHPASKVLNEHSEPIESIDPVWDNLFADDEQFFIRIAEGMQWLLSNGNRFEGCRRLYKAFDKLTGSSCSNRWPTITLRTICDASDIASFNSPIFFEYLKQKAITHLTQRTYIYTQHHSALM